MEKKNIIGAIEKYAIPSFKHIGIHLSVAIVLCLVLFLLVLKGRYVIGATSFVIITSSISAASGALLAISLALATFFSRHITDWRDKLVDRLEKGQIDLASQMARSAKNHPEISKRLTELYLQSYMYIPGQAVDTDEVLRASKIFNDWATTKALQSQRANRTFDFSNLNTYESLEKHLFDANQSCRHVRESLMLLSAAEKTSRAIAVFPPLMASWAVILLVSLIFAFMGGMGILDIGVYFPMLLMLLYLIVVSLISLVISGGNIIMHITRGLERGYEIAMAQLAQKSISDEKPSHKSKKI